MEYKDKILNYRIMHNLTQKEFADKVGLTREYISIIERGKENKLRPLTKGKLDKILNDL